MEEQKNKKSDFQYLIGRCYKFEHLYAKIYSIYSLNSNVITFEIMGISDKLNDIIIYQKNYHTVKIAEIDSLLISEAEFLCVLNKGFETIKNY